MSVTSNPASPVNVMSTVTVNCVVELGPAVMESELSLLMVDAELSRDGTQLTLANPTVTGTRFTYTRWFESFGRSDSGNYTCTATVMPQPSSTYLSGTGSGSSTAKITTGVLICGGHYSAVVITKLTFIFQVCILHLEVISIVMVVTLSLMRLEREMMELCSVSLTCYSVAVAMKQVEEVLWGCGFIPMDPPFKLKTLVMTFIAIEALVLCV